MVITRLVFLRYLKLSIHMKHYAPLRNMGGECKEHVVTPERRIFSGIQPTGILHLGNLLGAVQRWVSLQNQAACVYSIVDLHSITMKNDPQKLKSDIYTMSATLLACGIDPKKCILFLQSQVLEHTELNWILQCNVTMARLTHLPQYKEKTAKLKDIPLGIFAYPVLQCADIMSYKATDVPVGEDQIQHIQLAQHMTNLFNKKYKSIFPFPKALIDESNASRIKSLRLPDKKMSKSEPDPRSRIEILDDSDTIHKKFKKAITDCTSEVTFNPEKRPGVSNLITIHSLLSEKSIERIVEEAHGMETAKYKLLVADVVIEYVKPLREKVLDLKKNPEYIQQILRLGGDKAREIASNTLKEVKNSVGLTL